MIQLLLLPYVLFVNFRGWLRRRNGPRPVSPPGSKFRGSFAVLQIASILSGALMFMWAVVTGAALGVLLAPFLLTLGIFILIVWLLKALKG